jgi:hypothetical protein
MTKHPHPFMLPWWPSVHRMPCPQVGSRFARQQWPAPKPLSMYSSHGVTLHPPGCPQLSAGAVQWCCSPAPQLATHPPRRGCHGRPCAAPSEPHVPGPAHALHPDGRATDARGRDQVRPIQCPARPRHRRLSQGHGPAFEELDTAEALLGMRGAVLLGGCDYSPLPYLAAQVCPVHGSAACVPLQPWSWGGA